MYAFRINGNYLLKKICTSLKQTNVNSLQYKFLSGSCINKQFYYPSYSKYPLFWKLSKHHIKGNIKCLTTRTEQQKIKNRTVAYYCLGFVIFVGGFSYLSVLLYRLYCQATGKGGRAVLEDSGQKIAEMKAVKFRKIKVKFNADRNSAMMWNFKPSQPSISVMPGETALAFYTAVNPTNKPIIGIATYNVLPYEAGQYFNKIQCFCFEEQQLNPKEEVDLPVFFFLDPKYAEDPKLETIDEIFLSYTFFEAKEGLQLPMPTFAT